MFGTVQSKYVAFPFSQGLIHVANVLPPSTYSHTSISHAPMFMLGSTDFHSTLICCPGCRTCPIVGEISLAEYVPPALAVLTSCGAALSATAKTVANNRRVFMLFFLRLMKKSCEHRRDSSNNLQLLFCHLVRDCEMASYVDYFREIWNSSLTILPRPKLLSMMPELNPQRIKIPTPFFYRSGGAAARISRDRQERVRLQMVMQFGDGSFPGNYLHTRTEYRELLRLLAYSAPSNKRTQPSDPAVE